MQPIALRPLSFGELLDTAIGLYRRSFATVVAVSAIFTIPLGVITRLWAVGQADNLAGLENAATDEQVAAALLPFLGAFASIGLVAMLLNAVVQGATTVVYAGAYSGHRVAAGPAVRVGLRKALLIILLSIAVWVPAGIGLLLCILPGLALATIWYVAQPVLVIENRGVFRSMGRSSGLVTGQFWRTMGILLMALFLGTVFNVVLSLPLELFGGAVGLLAGTDAASVVANGAIAGVLSAITAPFTAAFAVATYFDLRVRKEGFDLVQLIDELPPMDQLPTGFEDPNDPFGLG